MLDAAECACKLMQSNLVLCVQSFSKPEVQAAIMDCTQDPMNILKYQNNEEIMRVSCCRLVMLTC